MTPEVGMTLPPQATRKQMTHLEVLFSERTRNPEARNIREDALALHKLGQLSQVLADEIIETVEGIPRDVFQREVPEGMVIVPGFYRAGGKLFEVERRATGRYAGYVYVYELQLVELEDGDEAWLRTKITRSRMTRTLKVIFDGH